jgi:hypothetical protein
MSSTEEPPRWETECKAVGEGEVTALWSRRDAGRTLMIGGAGFDPRAPVAYEMIAGACPHPVDVLRINLDSLRTDPATADLAAEGRRRIEAAAQATGATIAQHGNGGAASSTGMQITRDLFAAKRTDGYDDIILDISALPRSVFFPLLRGLLLKAHRQGWDGQLHVVACDNPAIDRLVAGDGADSPEPLPGFSDPDPPEGTPTTIWVPVLGEGETHRVDKLRESVSAQEVCPVLPFPSKNPRRADDIIREYRDLLAAVAVEPRNVIYASESNPFDLYRTLSKLNNAYKESLSPLGETRMILSAHSSKLLSVGVLLTAYEHDLEVRHVSPDKYTLERPELLPQLAANDLVVDLWLTGEPYA